MTNEETLRECPFTDHTPTWAGDGYFCSKCMIRFHLTASHQQIFERLRQKMPKENPAYENWEEWKNDFIREALAVIDRVAESYKGNEKV